VLAQVYFASIFVGEITVELCAEGNLNISGVLPSFSQIKKLVKYQNATQNQNKQKRLKHICLGRFFVVKNNFANSAQNIYSVALSKAVKSENILSKLALQTPQNPLIFSAIYGKMQLC
jgi:hypothetical protein